jgi:tetratricopeptide (TPR) repeat protein
MKSKGISLCVLARDEEECLPRLLRSARGVADETIVVDTGSTDATPAIARSFGARVLFHPFEDDFSAARNVALEAARYPWILVLDADEVLSRRSAPRIRRAVRDPKKAGFFLRFVNDLGGGREHVCGIVRLFRNDPSVRYQFAIHEQVVPSLLAFGAAHGLRLGVVEGVTVYHDGYRPERKAAREKIERNERLFRRQIEQYPEHVYTWYKYGDFLRQIEGRSAQARAALERAANLLRAMDPKVADVLSFPAEVYALLALEEDKAGKPANALAIAKEGLERHGESPNLLHVLAHLYRKAGAHREAFAASRRLRGYEHRLLAVPPEPGITGAGAWFGMGISLLELDRTRGARRCLERCVWTDPAHLPARLALARAHLLEGNAGAAAEQYAAALSIDPDQPMVRLQLGQTLLHLGRAEEAAAEFRAAAGSGPLAPLATAKIGEAFLAQGDLEGAYRAFLDAGSVPDAEVGRALLEALARGEDPSEKAAARTPAGQRFVRHLRSAGLVA